IELKIFCSAQMKQLRNSFRAILAAVNRLQASRSHNNHLVRKFADDCSRTSSFDKRRNCIQVDTRKRQKFKCRSVRSLGKFFGRLSSRDENKSNIIDKNLISRIIHYVSEYDLAI